MFSANERDIAMETAQGSVLWRRHEDKLQLSQMRYEVRREPFSSLVKGLMGREAEDEA